MFATKYPYFVIGQLPNADIVLFAPNQPQCDHILSNVTDLGEHRLLIILWEIENAKQNILLRRYSGCTLTWRISVGLT